MKAKIALVFAFSVLFLLIVSCTKGNRVAIVNHSSSPLKVKSIGEFGKFSDCNVEQMLYFKPDWMHDNTNVLVTIERANVRLEYHFNVISFDRSYADLRKRRIVFAFGDDNKVYLVKPSDDPIHEPIGSQPTGYPLAPAKVTEVNSK